MLEGRAEVIQQMRKLRGKIPANPRCRLCYTPFGGPGGFMFRKLSSINEPWEKNPTLCRRCVVQINSVDVMGAEVPASFLFADVRGSSDLARRLGAREFTTLMQRFYAVATAGAVRAPGVAGQDRRRRGRRLLPAVHGGGAARAAAVETAEAPSSARWVTGTAGRGCRSAPAFTRAGVRGLRLEGVRQRVHGARRHDQRRRAPRGEGEGQGEVLVTEAVGAALETDGLERRHLSLKGHEVDALVIAVDDVATSSTGAA